MNRGKKKAGAYLLELYIKYTRIHIHTRAYGMYKCIISLYRSYLAADLETCVTSDYFALDYFADARSLSISVHINS